MRVTKVHSAQCVAEAEQLTARQTIHIAKIRSLNPAMFKLPVDMRDTAERQRDGS